MEIAEGERTQYLGWVWFLEGSILTKFRPRWVGEKF